MKLRERIWKLCEGRGHVWWPPWGRVRRCAICGKFEELHVGDKSVTIGVSGNDILRWSATQSALALGDIGMNTSTGRIQAYINSASRGMVHQQENGLWNLENETELSAASSAINMTGLNGAADDVYVFIARVKGYPNAAITYLFRPNAGLTANQNTVYLRTIAGTTSTAAGTTRLLVGSSSASPTGNAATTIFTILHSRYSVQSNTVYRSYCSLWGSGTDVSTDTQAGIAGGAWYDTTTNLTSIQFSATWAMQAGTQVRLWKIENGT